MPLWLVLSGLVQCVGAADEHRNNAAVINHNATPQHHTPHTLTLARLASSCAESSSTSLLPRAAAPGRGVVQGGLE